MSAIADALSGCEATVSGWHVPRLRRRDLLRPGMRALVRRFRLLGGDISYVDRYEWNERPDKPTCLCGWRATEEAIGAIEDQARRILALDPAAGEGIEALRESVPVDAGDPAQREP